MVLVTGASGLLGREVVRRFVAAGRPVRGLDVSPSLMPDDAEFLCGDLLDASACRRACEGATCVIHTAARQHHSDMPRWGREAFFAANAVMTRNLVRAAEATGVKHIIFTSSDMVYGMPPGRPLTERDVPRPIGPYGRSKLTSEQACLEASSRGLRVTIFRPRLIVGPGRLGVLKKLFDCIRAGRWVPMLGDGRQRYQMVSVADVASACVLAAEQPTAGVFNLGSSEPPSVLELLSSLCRRAGSGSRVIALPRRTARAALWVLHGLRCGPLAPEQFRIADVDYVLDTSKARAELGWRPQHNDLDMLHSAYTTYVAGQKGALKNDPVASIGARASA
jgi:dTDP-glucose 4,6-dehydratase